MKRSINIIIFILLLGPISFCIRSYAGTMGDMDTFEISSAMDGWVGTWATAPLLVGTSDMPPEPGLTNSTLRQIVRVSLGGEEVRLRFSNIFGKEPLKVNAVSIAAAAEGSTIDSSIQQLLTFSQKSGVTIQANSEVFSDPVKFKLSPGSLLAITIYFGQVPSTITGHPGSRTTSYLLAGNHIGSLDFKGAIKTDRWYVINGVEVKAGPGAGAIAVLGNSITDGRGSGTNRQNRWTDILSERLLNDPATCSLGVLNLGIGGNAVIRGGIGPAALSRVDRDVFSQNGVRWVIILHGINDIGGIKSESDIDRTADDLIKAYSLMIDKAHARGIKVFGCTLLPYGDSGYDISGPFRQKARDKVNQWIKTSRKFDAVIDFDSIMQSDDNPKEIEYGLHIGDFLHPNEKGYRKMGEAIDLRLFQ